MQLNDWNKPSGISLNQPDTSKNKSSAHVKINQESSMADGIALHKITESYSIDDPGSTGSENNVYPAIGIEYRCQPCNKTFKNNLALSVHSRIHMGNKLRRRNICKFCQKDCGSKKTLASHIRAKHSNVRYINAKSQKCLQCGKICNNQKLLESHVRTQHEKIRIPTQTCQECGKVCANQERLESHIRNQHAKVVSCQECGTICKNKSQMRSHVEKFHSVANEKMSSNEAKLIETKEQPPKSDTTPTEISCFKCRKVCQSEELLARHMKNEHDDRTCKLCGKVFKSASFVERHMLVHTKEKPFQCPKCKVNYGQRSSLNFHLKNHTDRDFHCQHCELSFILEVRLNDHIKKAHNLSEKFLTAPKILPMPQPATSHNLKSNTEIEKPALEKLHSRPRNQCDKCFKVFLAPSHLKMHMVSHSDVRAFACLACHKTFKYLSHLKLHEKSSNDCRRKLEVDKSASPKTQENSYYDHFRLPPKSTTQSDVLPQSSNKKYIRPTSPSLKTTSEIQPKSRGRRRHVCQKCFKVFSQLSRLQDHMISHSDARNFQCEACHKTFKYSYGLSSHRRNSCQNEASANATPKLNMLEFKTILKTQNIQTENFSSWIIPHSSPALTKLQEPGRISVPISPEAMQSLCKVCGCDFVTEARLLRHSLTHTENINFPCAFCDRAFSAKQFLARHAAEFHGDLDTYNTNTNSKSTQASPDLEPHREILNCEHCGKHFFRKETLKAHARCHN